MPGPSSSDRRSRPADRPDPPRSDAAKLLLPLVLVAGTLFLCGGGAIGLVVFLVTRDEEVVEKPAEKPPEKPPAPAPVLVPPEPEPEPEPEPAPPPVAEKVFDKLWSTPIGPGAVKDGLLAVSADGKHVFAQDGGGVRVFAAATGEPVGRISGTGVPAGPAELWTLGADRLMLAGPPHPFPTVWHVGGTRAGEILPQQLLPHPQATNPTRFAVSPDGKHLFVGSHNRMVVPSGGNSGFALFDVKTAQRIGNGFWEPGNARFTADSTRLFVAEAGGRCRWLRVPGGVQEAGWLYPPAGGAAPLVSMSAEGALLLYSGSPAGHDRGRYLIDGRNGQVLRRTHATPAGGPNHLSADGRWLVGLSNGAATIIVARTGAELVREPLDGDPGDAAFRADGRAFVVADATRSAVAYYELRGPVPEPPSAAPPTPLSPAPDPLPAIVLGPMPPFGPQFGPPPFIGPPPVTPINPMPRPIPAPPPALKVTWTSPVDLEAVTLKPDYAPTFTPDGKVLVQYGGNVGIIQAFDAADGTPLPGYSGHKGGGLGWLATFSDRVASSGNDGKVVVWQARTGAKVSELAFPEVPAANTKNYGSVRAVSPTGRYTALARRPTNAVGAFKVLDTTTGNVIFEGPWHASAASGHISFSPDELKVFVVNGSGKAAWYRLPSGEKTDEWPASTGAAATTARVSSVSADGKRVVLYASFPGGFGIGTAVVDGKSGEIVLKLGNPPYQPAVASLSPDGALVALPVSDQRDGIRWHVDVLEVATGKKIGRASPPADGGAEVAMPRFSPDGKTLAVTFPGARSIVLNETPRPATAAPAATP